MHPHRPWLAVLVAIACALGGCVSGKTGTPTGTGVTRKGASAAPGASGHDGPVATASPRVVSQTGSPVVVTGEVRLISDNGAGVIANNGAAIISNNSGALVSNNGSGLVSKVKFRLAAAPANDEARLADAEVTVYDAAGHQLVGAEGQPLAARSDGEGHYRLSAVLPPGNLVLRIRLWNGGELSAMLPDQPGPTREQPIDTATSIGAAYVLSEYVKGDQSTYDRLPASEAQRLRRTLDAARPLLTAPPRYEARALVDLGEQLRHQTAAVDQSLDDIKVLLLGGLGDGKDAAQVAISRPRGLAVTADGTLYIAENEWGRIRRVSPAGKLTTYVAGSGGEIKGNFVDLKSLATGPDGALYVAASGQNLVYRVTAGAAPVVVAGTGADTDGTSEGLATAVPMDPRVLAVAGDGTLYVGDDDYQRIFKITPDGMAHSVAPAPRWSGDGWIGGLVVGPDGTLYALVSDAKQDGELARLAADGTWQTVLGGIDVGGGDLELAADGTFYIIEDGHKAVFALGKDGVRQPLVGPGAPAGAPEMHDPGSLAVAPDGTLYVADRTANLVYARQPSGTWKVAAGVTGSAQTGDGNELAFNGPAGLTFDVAGRLVVAETTGHRIVRYDGTGLTTLAGKAQGDAGDGGPASEMLLDSPSGVAYQGDELLIVDTNNHRLRAIGADGNCRTVVGAAGNEDVTIVKAGEPIAASTYNLAKGAGLVIGPDGLAYWVDVNTAQVLRLRADHMVELVAGVGSATPGESQGSGDGGPATAAVLGAPLDLAFNAAGDLFITDAASLSVRRISGLSSGSPRIDRFAGMVADAALARLLAPLPVGWETLDDGAPALDALLVLPAGLCFDPAGNCYVGELGTTAAGSTPLRDFAALVPEMAPRVRKIATDGRITTIVGPGGLFSTHPEAIDALATPGGVRIDPKGRLAIVDAGANVIRFLPAGSF